MGVGLEYQQLQERLKELEALKQAEDRENRRLQSEAWQKIMKNPDSWEWQVRPHEYKKFGGEMVQGCRVEQRIKADILKEWKKGGHATFSSDYEREDTWFGMFYYRTSENILTSDGGGHCVLNDPMLCNDEEWAAILRNEIPMKYRK